MISTDNIRVALNKKLNLKKSPTYKQYYQNYVQEIVTENVLIDWACLGTRSWNSGVL